MIIADLPDRWKQKLEEYLESQGDHKGLSVYDFDSNKIARLEFEDRSFAEFRHPLVIEAPELKEVAVFTEHCGYHIFSSLGVSVELLEAA